MSIPLHHISIDGFEINGNQIAMGGIVHDIDEATVTVTFCGVREVETVYSYMHRDDMQDRQSARRYKPGGSV